MNIQRSSSVREKTIVTDCAGSNVWQIIIFFINLFSSQYFVGEKLVSPSNDDF